MHQKLLYFLICPFVLAFMLAGGTTTAAGRDAVTVHAFVNVHVITMEREEVLLNHTVIVTGDRITEIGPAHRIDLPDDAVVIDGTGLYLMPGLADMHIHLNDERYLPHLLAAGITTVRNMAGKPKHLEWQQQVAAGERLGPRIFSSGPLLVSAPPGYRRTAGIETADGADEIVQSHLDQGFDFIKVHDDLSADAYFYLLDAAQTYEIPVVGHVPDELGIQSVLKSGQKSIEHLDGYTSLDEDRLQDAINTTVEGRVWVCPTLVAFQPLVETRDAPAYAINASTTALFEALRVRWFLSDDFRLEQVGYGPVPEQYLALTGELHAAGVPLLLGTDAPTPHVMPGLAVHQELENLAASGLSSFAALQTGTVNAARFLGQDHEFGTVTVGKQAELLLLYANPLSDIRNSRQIKGVFTSGQWYHRNDLWLQNEAG